MSEKRIENLRGRLWGWW